MSKMFNIAIEVADKSPYDDKSKEGYQTFASLLKDAIDLYIPSSKPIAMYAIFNPELTLEKVL